LLISVRVRPTFRRFLIDLHERTAGLASVEARELPLDDGLFDLHQCRHALGSAFFDVA
jgi:hypothetical protein